MLIVHCELYVNVMRIILLCASFTRAGNAFNIYEAGALSMIPSPQQKHTLCTVYRRKLEDKQYRSML